ncbi:MAG: PEP-CTERM sorting domain-containing protein [Telluria sp.]|nr:PEP-CTERM sorting domain-containing protein [Telluria sp.]
MNANLFSLKSLSLAVLLCAATAARADIDVFTTRASFLAAVAGTGTDTYNELAVASFGTSLYRMAGSYSYSAGTGPSSSFYTAGKAGGDVWVSTNNAFDTITFSNFSAGVHAMGGNFFASDVNGAFFPNASVVLSASDGSTTRTLTLGSTTPNTFLGFVSSNPLAFVQLGTGGGYYWPTANNVILAAVPEPGAYSMLLAGLLMMGSIVKRRDG